MTIDKTLMTGLGLLVTLAGCPGDDSSTTTVAGSDSTGPSATEETGSGTTPTPADTTMGETGMTEDSGDPPEECLGTGEGTAAEGDACTANSECASGVCTIFTDVPLNDDAVCGPIPASCGTRVTGTIFDFSTGEPVGGADLVVAAALQAATNPTGAMAIVSATSGADGRVDETSADAISAPLGIVGLASSGGFFLTATGLAAPGPDGVSYDVATGNHDIWMVPEGDLTDWSDELSNDPAIDPADLPLGELGGAVGFVRDSTGAPIAGATVASTGDSSDAVIRYLNDDGTFTDTETSDLGIFVILNPAVPEDFEASVGGMVVGGGTAGSANGVVFTLIVTAP